MSQFRHDPLDRTWVLISPKRDRRPRVPLGRCPFCVGNEDLLPKVKDGDSPNILFQIAGPGGDRQVIAVPNLFNALEIEPVLQRLGVGEYLLEKGVGAHEVVVEHPYGDHRPIFDLSPWEIRHIFKAWKERLLDLKKDRRFICPVVYKNHGEQAGQSIEHPHSQGIFLPIVPKRVEDICMACQEFYDKKRVCLLCKIIGDELDGIGGEDLVVDKNDEFVAWVYRAGKFPFELKIAPRTHDHRFENTRDEYFESLGTIYKHVLAALDKAKKVHFNTMLFTSPWFENDERPTHGATVAHDFHWFLEIDPRSINSIAGFELGSGVSINPVNPVDAANTLRSFL